MSAPSSVGIVGVGEPGYRPHVDATLPELVHRAARAALDDAGLSREELDNVVACASDLDDGRAISSMMTASPGGSYEKDFVKTTGTGIHAVELGMIRMESGMFNTTLLISWGKATEADQSSSVPLEGDPFYRRNTGLGYLSGHAMQAAALVDNNDDAETAAAHLAAHNTEMGENNSRVEGCEAISDDVVTDSEIRAWPLRNGHLPADADGATALVLATEEAINEQNLDNDPVWIQGIGRQTATYNAGNRPFGKLPTLATAAQRAYNKANISNPRTEVKAAEIHGNSAFHELIALEALDLAENNAVDEILSGDMISTDGIAVNRSGGTLAANPLLGAGLARVAAATRQVRGDGANGDSIPCAVAHATAGYTDQAHGVAVLGGERHA